MKTFKKYSLLMGGLASLGLGAAMLISGNVGGDGFSVFNQGLALRLGVMPGTVSIAIGVIYGAFVLAFIPKYRTVGTVIIIFALGTIINGFLILLGFLNVSNWHFFVRCLVMLAGCNFVGLGIALNFVSDAGMHPNDIIPILISEKIKKNYKNVRVFYDLTYASVGFLLGGVVGVGTVVSTLAIGPISKGYMDLLSKRAK